MAEGKPENTNNKLNPHMAGTGPELNKGHISGKRVLSPLHHHYFSPLFQFIIFCNEKNLANGEVAHNALWFMVDFNNSPGVVPSSFMLSIMVISFFNLAIDSCSFPLDRKSLLKPGIIP